MHSILGMMLYQHFHKTNSTSILIQTNESELMHISPMETPMPSPPATSWTPQETPQETLQRRPTTQGVPATIGAGFTSHPYAYHNGDNPLLELSQYEQVRQEAVHTLQSVGHQETSQGSAGSCTRVRLIHKSRDVSSLLRHRVRGRT